MRQRFTKIIIFLVGILLIVNLTRSIINIWQKGSLLDREEERFAKTRLESEELKKKYQELQTQEYIEREARNKLGLGKEGEVVVVLPPQNPLASPKAVKNEESEAIWKQWLSLLF